MVQIFKSHSKKVKTEVQGFPGKLLLLEARSRGRVLQDLNFPEDKVKAAF